LQFRLPQAIEGDKYRMGRVTLALTHPSLQLDLLWAERYALVAVDGCVRHTSGSRHDIRANSLGCVESKPAVLVLGYSHNPDQFLVCDAAIFVVARIGISALNNMLVWELEGAA